MKKRNLLESLASSVQAYHNCVQSNNEEWQAKHEDRINQLVELLPHGSGIDGNTSINLDQSNGRQYIVIDSEYHYMDEMGGYAGWFYFSITVIANLDGYPDYNFTITSNDTEEGDDYIDDMFSDYLVELFGYALTECTPAD